MLQDRSDFCLLVYLQSLESKRVTAVARDVNVVFCWFHFVVIVGWGIRPKHTPAGRRAESSLRPNPTDLKCAVWENATWSPELVLICLIREETDRSSETGHSVPLESLCRE